MNMWMCVQVIDWISLLIDAHYVQMALSSDTPDLHARLQTAVQTQVPYIHRCLACIILIMHIIKTYCSTACIQACI